MQGALRCTAADDYELPQRFEVRGNSIIAFALPKKPDCSFPVPVPDSRK